MSFGTILFYSLLILLLLTIIIFLLIRCCDINCKTTIFNNNTTITPQQIIPNWLNRWLPSIGAGGSGANQQQQNILGANNIDIESDAGITSATAAASKEKSISSNSRRFLDTFELSKSKMADGPLNPDGVLTDLQPLIIYNAAQQQMADSKLKADRLNSGIVINPYVNREESLLQKRLSAEAALLQQEQENHQNHRQKGGGGGATRVDTTRLSNMHIQTASNDNNNHHHHHSTAKTSEQNNNNNNYNDGPGADDDTGPQDHGVETSSPLTYIGKDANSTPDPGQIRLGLIRTAGLRGRQTFPANQEKFVDGSPESFSDMEDLLNSTKRQPPPPPPISPHNHQNNNSMLNHRNNLIQNTTTTINTRPNRPSSVILSDRRLKLEQAHLEDSLNSQNSPQAESTNL